MFRDLNSASRVKGADSMLIIIIFQYNIKMITFQHSIYPVIYLTRFLATNRALTLLL